MASNEPKHATISFPTHKHKGLHETKKTIISQIKNKKYNTWRKGFIFFIIKHTCHTEFTKIIKLRGPSYFQHLKFKHILLNGIILNKIAKSFSFSFIIALGRTCPWWQAWVCGTRFIKKCKRKQHTQFNQFPENRKHRHVAPQQNTSCA